ncbi:MAG: hypothetical protein NVSMB46_00020 [Candidatus Saccharimonadales bacterium]
MSEINEIIDQNNFASDFVVDLASSIDNTTAELILRSTAVAADRLTPRQVSKLGKPALDALLDAATAAKEIAPLGEADSQRLPSETDAEFHYRTEVWQPLHRLQSIVSLGEYEDKPHTVAAVKRAVWLGSTAFEKVLTDPSAVDCRELQRTVGYFGGNTRAAASRAERLKNPRD